MESIEYKFYALTPTDDVDIGVYQNAFNFVFLNDNIHNIALSGPYGAGKSSILASYKKKYPARKFIHISLAHFHLSDENTNNNATGSGTTTESILEGKLLNQLIHQIPPECIPRTIFRVKKRTSRKRDILSAVFAALDLVIGLYLLAYAQWSDFIKTFKNDWLKRFLSFTAFSETRLLAGFILFVISVFFAYRFVILQKNRYIIKKADISGVGIEIFEDSNESYFDKYLNEVLYLFENANADVIVFEDIDRYDSIQIFERLHEINTLVNHNRKNNPLRFFYLTRDDIFTSKDRTKFFDFIIPVIPVIDGSNSFNKLIEIFEQNGLIGKDNSKINPELLQGLSLYIDDMRILQNICNELLIYQGGLATTEQDPNKLLAIIVYKNLFPRDFAELQFGQGFMFEIIGGNGKARLLSAGKSVPTVTEDVKLKDIINRDNIDNLFKAEFRSEMGFVKKFSDIKDSPYFPLLKYFVFHGFIDETYFDYMSYFYENSLSKADKIFLRSVTDMRAKEFSYKLCKPAMIPERLPLSCFSQKEVLNYDLFEYLLTDFHTKRSFAPKTKTLIRQIKDGERFDFVLGYCEQKEDITDLVKTFGIEWPSFIADFFTAYGIESAFPQSQSPNDLIIKKWMSALLKLDKEKVSRSACMDEASEKKLMHYVSNNSDLLQ